MNYASPENVRLSYGFQGQHVGRKSDIWSFGCILTEIVVYMETPSINVIDRFREERKATYKFPDYLSTHYFFQIQKSQKDWTRSRKSQRAKLDELWQH